MRGRVTKVIKHRAHTPPKSIRYYVEVELENGRKLTFFKSSTNAPPDKLWEDDEVEVVWRKNKEDGMVLPFIV